MPNIHPENAGKGTGSAATSKSNLRPIESSEKAREMQKKSAEARKFNKEMREHLKLTARDFNKMKKDMDLSDLPSSVEFLKFRMLQLMSEGEMDKATDIAKTLAEFEAPKLARVDQSNVNFEAGDLSDEELEAELARLSKKK